MATISFLTLANHAEVREGFLYLSGAEWDTVTRSYSSDKAPQPVHLGIAFTVIVPWTEANEPHTAEIWIEDEDAHYRVMATTVNIEVGRPPGKVPGSDTRVPLAMNGIIQFPKAGGYRVQAQIGKEQKTYSFRVADRLSG